MPGNVLSVAEAMARQGGPPLTLHPFRPLKVGLVATELPGLKDSVTDKTIAITEARITALTGSLLPPLRVPARGGRGRPRRWTAWSREGADLLLVVGASAVVDRRDVGPAGIVRAGGEILHFGMPVDPGNLICLGRIGEQAGAGAARLRPQPQAERHRLRAAAAVRRPAGRRRATSMRMGVGGLLKEIETRPLPREKAPATPRAGAAPRSAPTIAAVVLAAGRSRRMAPHNKLLVADRAGKPMIARVVDNVLVQSNARPILVVTGHQAEQVEHALGGRPVRYVHAPDYAEGLSASLKAGHRRGAAGVRRGASSASATCRW